MWTPHHRALTVPFSPLQMGGASFHPASWRSVQVLWIPTHTSPTQIRLAGTAARQNTVQLVKSRDLTPPHEYRPAAQPGTPRTLESSPATRASHRQVGYYWPHFYRGVRYHYSLCTKYHPTTVLGSFPRPLAPRMLRSLCDLPSNGAGNPISWGGILFLFPVFNLAPPRNAT
jgi:hypothetical protein